MAVCAFRVGRPAIVAQPPTRRRRVVQVGTRYTHRNTYGGFVAEALGRHYPAFPLLRLTSGGVEADTSACFEAD